MADDVIVADCKVTVKIGDFSRGGQTRGDDQASDHDFGCEEKYTPFGMVDEDSAPLHLIFGSSYPTSDFIVDAVESRWNGPQPRKLHVNGHTRMTRTPRVPPPPMRPRERFRLWRLAYVAGPLLILAIGWLIGFLSHREPPTETSTSVQLQVQHQEAIQALRATRLELERGQGEWRVANRKLRLQPPGRVEQTHQQRKLNERLFQFLLAVETAFLFDPGQVALRPEGRLVLDQISAVLRSFSDYGVQTTRHAPLDEIAKPALDRWAAAWQVAALQAASTSFYMTEQGLMSSRPSAPPHAVTTGT